VPGLETRAWFAPLLLSGVWLLLLLSVWPAGEFPLNDDWVYAASVRSLVEEGRLAPSPYTEASYVTQALWGGLFCLPGGWSYSALRLSTAVLGLAGVLVCFALLLEAGAGRRLAMLAALTLAANPLYLNLSLTFMTDVPFAALCLAALLFLARSLRRDSWGDFLVGSALSVAAVLTRQAGLVVALAYAAVALQARPVRTSRMIQALLSPLLAGAVLLAWHYWARTRGVDWLSNDRLKDLFTSLSAGVGGAVGAVSWRAAVALVYVGFFTLPLLAPAAAEAWHVGGPAPRHGAQVALTFFGLTWVALTATGARMPLSENLLHDSGVGPPTLWDVYIEHLPNLPKAPALLWTGITVLALIGGALLAGVVAAAALTKALGRSPAVALVGITASLYAALMVTAGYFDRYLILLVPLCAVLVSTVAGGRTPSWLGGRTAFLAGVALATTYGLFGAAATHDYFAWNRARWAAIDDAIRVRGVPASGFDGGYEWNGLNRYSPTKPWWWADREPWVIAFGPVPGYGEVARYPYRRLLPPGEATLLLLHREEP